MANSAASSWFISAYRALTSCLDVRQLSNVGVPHHRTSDVVQKGGDLHFVPQGSFVGYGSMAYQVSHFKRHVLSATGCHRCIAGPMDLNVL